MMLHTIHTMTIRRYGQLDATEDLSLLKRWFNPFPVGWFNVPLLVDRLKSAMGLNNLNDVKDGYNKILTVNRIIALEEILKTLSILMQEEDRRKMMGYLLNAEVKETESIKYYIQKVEELAGIRIEKFEDLKRLQKEIERMADKYMERYPQKKTPDKAVNVLDVFWGVFDVMEMPINWETSCYEFGRLKERADKKIKAL